MFRKSSWLRVVFTVLFFVALLSALELRLGKTQTNNFEGATDETFSEAYYDLLRFFIHPLKSDSLIQGAAKGMDITLTRKKIPHTMPSVSLSNSPTRNLEAFRGIFGQVLSKVNGKLPQEELMASALNGMFEATGDPYTIYLSPKDYRTLTEQMNGGNFGGVGIYIELEKGTKQLIVLEPIEDTPAFRAGLKAGDYIMKIDGKSTKGMDLDSAQSTIRGPVGSSVVLTIQRKGVPGEKDFTLTRALIHVKSVSAQLKNGAIGYIRLRTFGEYSGQELEKAMEDLEAKGAKAYILDLRNNGGGYIEAAKEICSKFLPRGAVIVSVLERSGHIQREYADGSEHPDLPLVVLVNEFSASASEITAGALQDYKRAKILGTRTFGKGSVQTIIRLNNRGAAKITIAHYATPTGRDINKKGITPDIPVTMKGHDFGGPGDEQLEKAVNTLKEVLSQAKASL